MSHGHVVYTLLQARDRKLGLGIEFEEYVLAFLRKELLFQVSQFLNSIIAFNIPCFTNGMFLGIMEALEG
jgi:hypothetical protein